jgi:hypothetical protein
MAKVKEFLRRLIRLIPERLLERIKALIAKGRTFLEKLAHRLIRIVERILLGRLEDKKQGPKDTKGTKGTKDSKESGDSE